MQLPDLTLDKLQHITDAFEHEISRAQRSLDSSLLYVRTPLPETSTPKNPHYQALVIGGSFIKSAIVSKQRHQFTLHQVKKHHLPEIKNVHLLFDILSQIVSPDTTNLALNFAYPLEPTIREGLLDGELISGSKEHDFNGLVGRLVGQEIEAYFQDTKNQTIHTTVANDSTCLLLSGLTSFNPDTLAASIIGTGINLSFFENKNTAINLESANFNKFDPSPSTQKIDQESDRPDHALYEKEISGAYLYQHYNLLAPDVTGKPLKPLTSSDQLSDLASDSTHPGHTLANQILNHSAKLAACQIAGLYHFKKSPNLNLVMEGSLFWHGTNYKQTLQETLVNLDISRNAISFQKIINSDLVGAVKLIS